MKLKDYIKDKLIPLFVFTILIIFLELFLLAFHSNLFLVLYVPITIILVVGCIVFSEYMRKRNFYHNVKYLLDNLDKKYYLQEMIEEPEFLEGKLLYEIIRQSNKSMVDNVNMYKHKEEEYREYIELWVHEIKTPIASSKLIIENNQNKVTENIEEEIDKIDNYVEQALYYSRSNNVEKDYIVKEVKLDSIIRNVILKNKKELIGQKIKVNLHDVDKKVYSDSKWLEYIINQIVGNSIKYIQSDGEIEIYAQDKKDRVVLNIKDNGIGIPKEELNNVFEKGFTGTNGRKYTKSTGMGLYICKKLCDKLDHRIGLNSKRGEYTNVYITFPIGSLTKMK